MAFIALNINFSMKIKTCAIFIRSHESLNISVLCCMVPSTMKVTINYKTVSQRAFENITFDYKKNH